MKIGYRKITIFLTAIILGLFMVNNCGGTSCSCLTPLEKPFPTDHTFSATDHVQNRPAQIRLTTAGIGFLEQNLGSIIAQFMPGGGLAFDVPPTTTNVCIPPLNWPCVDLNICKNPCHLTATIQSVNFEMVEPDSIVLHIQLALTGTVTIDDGILLTHCDVPIHIDHKPVQATVLLSIEKVENYMTFDIKDMQVTLANEDYDISCGGLAGWLVGLLKGIITSQLNNQVKSMLNDALTGQLGSLKCLACDFYTGGCPTGSTCDNNNTCIDDTSKACRPNPLGVVGTLDAGSLLASFAPGLNAKMDMFLVVGQKDQPPQDKLIENGGISLSMLGGVTSNQNMCVPATTPPAPPAAIPEAGFVNQANICQKCDPANPACPATATCDAGSKTCKMGDGSCPAIDYMAGIGVHEWFIQQMLWSAFNAGVLCLNIGTSTISMLTSGTIGALLPEIGYLTDKRNSPVLLSLRPTQAPVVKLEVGTLKDDGSGKMVIVKPLLLVQINQIAIDFYVFVYDRYTRIFSLTADLELPVALDVIDVCQTCDPAQANSCTQGTCDPTSKTCVDANNKCYTSKEIQPILGDIGKGIKNIKVTNTEMLATEPATIESAFGALIGSLLGPLLGGGLGGFALPAIQGFNLEILAIRGEMPYTDPPDCSDTDESKPGCYEQFLTIYANLAMAKPPPYQAITRAWVDTVEVPPIEKFRLLGTKDQVLPRVTVGVAGNHAGLEYSWRLDGGTWSFFQPGPRIVIESPILVLQGRHTIDVRSRVAGIPGTMDQKGVTLTAIIDAQPPEIEVKTADDGTMTVTATDLVTRDDDVVVQYRIPGGDWIAVRNGSALPPEVAALGVADIRAVDETGHEALVSIGEPLEAQSGSSTPGAGEGAAAGGGATVDAGGCGCTTLGL